MNDGIHSANVDTYSSSNFAGFLNFAIGSKTFVFVTSSLNSLYSFGIFIGYGTTHSGYGTTPVGCRGGNRYVEGELLTFG